MGDQVIRYMPSQISLILGKDRREVLKWIEEGKLGSVTQYGRAMSSAQDIARFLNEHPEEVGRVYCDDLIPFFNRARENIVEKLENLNEVSNLWQDYPSNRSRTF